MDRFDEFYKVIKRLRAKDGCPWDREQTHATLKAPCMEEAAEVICGINIYEETGCCDNLKEELGDLLLQVMMHAVIAEEEGLFTIEDVIDSITQKMIRRHPHVFGDVTVADSGEVLANWEQIKKTEKEKVPVDETKYLFEAFDEAEDLIDCARKRKESKLRD